jgi:hypothetical protein
VKIAASTRDAVNPSTRIDLRTASIECSGVRAAIAQSL